MADLRDEDLSEFFEQAAVALHFVGPDGTILRANKAELDLLYSEAADNFKAYAVKGHRHHPEIMESLTALEGASGRKLGLTFVPHLVPMIRGILATLYAPLKKSDVDLQTLYEKRYAGEPFVQPRPFDPWSP